MLRKCLLVLSNAFFNAFFECSAEFRGSYCEIDGVFQTYQQRLFLDGDLLNYRFSSDHELVFGVASNNDGTPDFDDELLVNLSEGVKFIDVDSNISSFTDLLDSLHGLFVTKGIASIVTVYFSPKQS